MIISDRKKRLAGATPLFEAVIETAQDYYPFGSLVPGRKYNAGEYRFGFNGQEKDDEIAGVTGSHLNYKYRVHDTRLGRFLSIDPIASKFPHNSPYAFSENRVIDGVEWEGLEVVLVGKQEAAGIVVSGNIEVGIAITPDGVYGYGSTAIGLESNISVATQVSVTFFPSMPASGHAEGWGFDGGVAGGELVVGSLNAAYSDGYWGVNATIGVGASAIPIDGGAFATYTALKPLSEVAKKSEALNILNESKLLISDRINSLTQQKNELMQQENYNQEEFDNLNSDIYNMNSALDQINKGIEEVNAMEDDD